MKTAEKDIVPALPDAEGHIESPHGAGNAGNCDDRKSGASGYPDFKISGCFSAHMVIQRSVPAAVYGFSSHPGMKVTGTWLGETAVTEVGPDGRFRLVFSAHEADPVPSRMIISSPYGSYILSDILVGDVWLVGGQSNAELSLAACLFTTPELESEISGEDNFRLFRQSQAGAFEFKDNCASPYEDIIKPEWRWKRPDRDASMEFSAMGYYFAKELTKHIDVPLGLIMVGPGGACLRELMPEKLAIDRGYTVGANMPVGGYYNTLLSPFEGFAFYGQLFFQGESEGIWKEMAYKYADDLAAMIIDERKRFGVNFPFYNVQLSSYREEGKTFFPFLHIVRLEQFRALSLIPDSHLAVDRDLGADPDYPDWPHSPHKAELGRRLAMQVWAYEYGGKAHMPDAAEYESPLPVSVRPGPEPGTFEIKFINTGNGLRTCGGGEPKGFGILAKGKEEPVPACAKITGPDTVLVTAGEAKLSGAGAEAVTFAHFHIAGKAEADLENSFGLPAPAFRLGIG